MEKYSQHYDQGSGMNFVFVCFWLAIPTSNNKSREIADKPYGSVFWNILIIDGLRQTENNEAEKIAKNIAAALVKTVYNEHKTHGTLFENVINYRISNHIRLTVLYFSKN